MVRSFLLFLLVVVVVPKFTKTIYIPGDGPVKKPPPNFGLKTLQWQNPGGGGGNPEIHHNYSKVSTNNGGAGGKYTQAPILEVSKTHQPIVTYFPKKPQHTQAHTKCPKLSTGRFIYEFSCNQFLNCWKGRGYPQNCPPGTLFNPKTLECDHAEKVECVSTPGNPPEEGSTTIQPPCPEGFSGLIPHYGDCTKFFNCAQGRQIPMTCPPGTNFDVTTNNCDLPERSTCFGGGKKGRSVGGPEKNVEGVFCGGGLVGVFAHPGDCSKYFNCTKSGEEYVGKCVGRLFNHVLQVCDLAYNVNCDAVDRHFIPGKNQGGSVNNHFSGGVPQQTFAPTSRGLYQNTQNYGGVGGTLQNPTVGASLNTPGYTQYSFVESVFCGNLQGIFAHPQDCSKYFNCTIPGRGFVVHCQNGFFNHLSNRCDLVQNVNCGSSDRVYFNHNQNFQQVVEPKCPQSAQGLYPHPGDCAKFLNCANGLTYIQDCAPGTLFNGVSKICDFPHNVVCTSGGKPHFGYTPKVDYPHQNFVPNQFGDSQNLYPITVQDQNFNQNYYQRVDLNQHQYLGAREYPQSTLVMGVQMQNPLSVDGRPQGQHPQNGEVPDLNQHFGQTPLRKNQGEVQQPSKNPKKGKWPPPFPTSDANADYIFDSEDTSIPLQPTVVAITTNSTNYLGMFLKKPNTKLAVREKTKTPNMTLESCAHLCAKTQGFQCRSFNFRRHDGLCLLTDTNIGLSGMLIKYPPLDYYENTRFTIDCTKGFKCPNDKCLGRLQICDGVDDCGDRTDEKNCSAQDLGYGVRLAGSHFDNEGRIEVTVLGKTGYVCDDNFGLQDAEVVCRELGYPLGAVEVKGHSYFAPEVKDNDTFFMMDDVTCGGNEGSLRDCDFSGWGVHNCLNQEIVGVVCRTPLEQCPGDFWKCDSGQECLPLAFVCDGVQDCTDGSDESDPHCEAPIELRLVNGTTPSEGRIEIKYHGTWGTICDDDFNEDAAKVVCKHFGYRGTSAVRKDAFYGPGQGPIWLDQVYCQGNETHLQDCTHWNWGEHNCEHSEDVGVVCSNFDNSGSERKAKVQVGAPGVLPGPITGGGGYKPTTCGLRNDDLFNHNDDVHFRVIKGTIAKKGEYPWQASIRVKGKSKPAHWCGAVVITNKFLLTAAHCLIGFSKGAYLVVAGDYNVDDEEGTEQQAYIEDFYIHEDFRKEHRMNNDIALIKLKGPGFVLTKDIHPICLPEHTTPYDEDLNCTISGFGSIQSGKSAYSHDLRAGWIPIQSEDVCKMPHVYGSAITPGMFCAGSLEEGVDACDGDSGGPLACLKDGLFTLYGLTSWGQHCGHANKPGVYVKISHYRKWIDEVIDKHR